jgi:hypothetical protein
VAGEPAELAAGGPPDLAPSVEQARADLAFAEQLDEIRYGKWLHVVELRKGTRFAEAVDLPLNQSSAPGAYRAPFLARGLDVDTANLSELAARLGASGIKAELVAALDDWALYEPDVGRLVRLLELTLRADPGDWTGRLRDPAVRRDRRAVAALAAEADSAVPTPDRLADEQAALNLLDYRRRALDARRPHP